MTDLCMCSAAGLQDRCRNISSEKRRSMERDNAVRKAVLAEQDIGSILRLVGGDSANFVWKVIL